MGLQRVGIPERRVRTRVVHRIVMQHEVTGAVKGYYLTRPQLQGVLDGHGNEGWTFAGMYADGTYFIFAKTVVED